jgi:hypothetical protein
MTRGRHEATRARPATRAGSRARRGLLVAAGSLALIVAAAGTVTALAHPASVAPQHERSGGSSRESKLDVARPTSHRRVASPLPSPSSAPDPTALADGTYPGYLGAVDVGRGTITVDLVQTFSGTDAVRAAMQDGIPRREARQYLGFPAYVRNQNDLLRTLSLREDASIQFVGECESPGDAHAALAELARRTTPFDTTYFYAITVENDQIVDLVQHIAVPAC